MTTNHTERSARVLIDVAESASLRENRDSYDNKADLIHDLVNRATSELNLYEVEIAAIRETEEMLREIDRKRSEHMVREDLLRELDSEDMAQNEDDESFGPNRELNRLFNEYHKYRNKQPKPFADAITKLNEAYSRDVDVDVNKRYNESLELLQLGLPLADGFTNSVDYNIRIDANAYHQMRLFNAEHAFMENDRYNLDDVTEVDLKLYEQFIVNKKDIERLEARYNITQENQDHYKDYDVMQENESKKFLTSIEQLTDVQIKI